MTSASTRPWAPPGRRRWARPLGLALSAAFLLGACGGAPRDGSATGGDRLVVLTTTTVFADLVANVGGSSVQATSLVPRGGDVHTFEPRPHDILALARAKLIVMNGLGLDDWLEKTVANVAEGARVVKLGVALPGVELLAGDQPGTENPHLWMDVTYAERYVDRIAAALEQVDPTHASVYAGGAANYRQQVLGPLDAWVRQQVATIPPANRRIVTMHDAFPYFAREYGITIVGVAVEAPGQDPSSGYTSQLIGAIKASGAKAIFSESQFPTKLVDQLAAETGAAVVSNLYDDSLGDPPITSYEQVIRWDVSQLVEALR